MRLLHEPDDPWTAFYKGAGATALAVGLPIALGILFMRGDGGLLERVKVVSAIVGSFCLIAGIGRAVWSLVQRWAYDKVTNDPFG